MVTIAVDGATHGYVNPGVRIPAPLGAHFCYGL